ncbi:hypothetical protein CCHL11_09422 [Colletotrichum chlorophyti]|uniref:Zn(2)-C6 fungal-type domain-containing protein n=1 Tax=Colletotrichum chlorophyti TaxID=708187 RepID=A0A1Q8R9L1_9PEZI|nr:hypothetical protein CCHL11_09422 [Colletotrichum chlorophyti]
MPAGVATHDSGAHSVVGSGIAAPYGRACTNCARAKCKCILRPVGGACERCHRLNKTCQPSNPVRKRSKKPPSRQDRTAQLEEKLDGLVTLLRQSGRPDLPANLGLGIVDGHPPPDGPTPAHTAKEPSTERGDVHRGAGPSSSSSSSPEDGSSARGASLPTPTQTTSPEGADYGDELPSADEAEALFESFRGQNLKYLPFLHFKATMTARELRAERPFLWLCIMTVASRVSSQQIALGQRVRQITGQKLLVDNERSIDYLLGLLAVLGWANHQLGNKPFMCMFSQLAIGLVFDLGLTRDPSDGLNPFLCWKAAQEKADKDNNGVARIYVKAQAPRTMEQRRAAIACYFITSVIAGFLGKMDPMRWTSHMDESLQLLDEQPECPPDRTLVALVKMQLLNEEARRLSGSWRPDGPCETPNGAKTPPSMYVKLLQGQLQHILQSLPAELQSVDSVISLFHCTELAINEIALSGKAGAYVPANLPDVARLDILYACLHAIKAWFDHFFTIPPAAYPGTPFSFFAQLSHCIFALYRLSILDDPVWDRASVRSTIDLLATLDAVALRFQRACAEAGLEVDIREEHGFAKAATTIRGIKGHWEGTIAPLVKADAAAAPVVLAAGAPMVPGVGEVELGQFGLDLMDNRWFTDIFTPFEM